MMRSLIVAVMVGAGLLLAAGCECGCTKSACPMPADLKEEISSRMAPAEYPSVTMSGEMDFRVEVVDVN